MQLTGPLRVIICLATAIIGHDAAMAAEFSGAPRIIDGDTIQFGETKLRLAGIDAPQMDQRCFNAKGRSVRCGFLAREKLRLLAGGAAWRCKSLRKNAHGRLLGRCSVNGEDVAAEMVRAGWALATTRRSSAYADDEQAARAAENGMWAGAFVAPQDWRRRNEHAKVLGSREVDETTTAQLLSSAFGAVPPSADCTVKGNVNWGGKCIFHQPGGRSYKKIKMEARYGDRWFCSAREAIASGCRETKR